MKTILMALSFTLAATAALAQANSWTNATTAGGQWHDAAKWSLGVAPSNNQSRVFITNSVTKTVLINSVTAGAFQPTLTVSNITLSAPPGSVNRLVLSNSVVTPLRVLAQLSIESNGVLIMTNAQMILGRNGGGGTLRNSGSMVLRASSTLVATNAVSSVSIGSKGTGSFLMSGGTALLTNVVVGGANPVTFEGVTGTFTFSGGTADLGRLRVGFSEGTGTVWITGGTLTSLAGVQDIGDGSYSAGRVVISNGAARLGSVRVGNASLGIGTLSVHGGVTDVSTALTISQNDATGIVAVTGGSLIVTNGNGEIIVGDTGYGKLEVSGGSVRSDFLTVAGDAGSLGELRMTGGTNLTGFLELAGSTAATGTTWVTGGRLESLGSFWLGNGVGQMTVSNGVVVARGLVVSVSSSSRGTLTMVGGQLIASNAVVGLSVGNTGTVWQTGGTVFATNGPGNGLLLIGDAGRGVYTLSNGTVVADRIVVTNGVSDFNFFGGTVVTRSTKVTGTGWREVGRTTLPAKLDLVGGTHDFGVTLDVADGTTWAIGELWMKANQLFVTNDVGILAIGSAGRGSYVQSNGVAVVDSLKVARIGGSSGTYRLVGGTNIVNADFRISPAEIGGQTGTGVCWMTGGALLITNGSVNVGGGYGQWTISNGTLRARNLSVGAIAGSSGLAEFAGGTSLISSNLRVGRVNCGSTARVILNAGNLHITNATLSGTLEIQGGTFTWNAGSLIVDQLILTNPCARFIKALGLPLIVNGMIDLDFALDADGDGMSNQSEFDYGLLPFNPVDADWDNDGDGLTNLQEFQTRTDPTNSASALRIIAISRSGSNEVQIKWTAGRGTTSAVERTTGAADGSYTNAGWTTIGSAFASGTGLTTNTIISGGVTNNPALYYRLRWVP